MIVDQYFDTSCKLDASCAFRCCRFAVAITYAKIILYTPGLLHNNHNGPAVLSMNLTMSFDAQYLRIISAVKKKIIFSQHQVL